MSGATDRTKELFALADARWKLRGRAPIPRPRPAKTPFGQGAVQLGRALHATEERTTRLGKLASKSSLFDDPAAEIGEISAAVRDELTKAGAALEALRTSNRPRGRQFGTHADAVLAWLATQHGAVTSGFQGALKQREATISNKESRAARLGVASVGSPFGATATPNSSRGVLGSNGSSINVRSGLVKQPLLPEVGGVRHRRPPGGAPSWQPLPGTSPSSVHTPPASGGGRPQQRAYHEVSGFGSPAASWDGDEVSTPEQLQQQLWTPRSQRHRAQEVSQMHKTLAELSSMFGRFSSIVVEQGESIRSIEENTEAAEINIESAHSEIEKYQKMISSHRGLILKTFFVLFFLIIIYGTLSR